MKSTKHFLKMCAIASAFFMSTCVSAQIILPGKIEAEEYSLYKDSTPGNTGGAYRKDDVDINVTSDDGGGYNIGWIKKGEWLSYDVIVPQSGNYDLSLRMASGHKGTKSARVRYNGKILGKFSIKAGKGWQAWQSVTIKEVNLPTGSGKLRIEMLSGLFNINYLDVQISEDTPPPKYSWLRRH